MYCIKCGVKLSETEKVCPLCETRVYHPDIEISYSEPLYPVGKIPKMKHRRYVFSGAVIIMFLIALIVSFMADIHFDGALNWFYYVLGALILGYSAVFLPMWFKKPNPVIFTPCSFAVVCLYLLYINLANGGGWFLSFAFPVTACAAVITEAIVTLVYYLKKGKLYIFGGAFMLLGAYSVLIEYLIYRTFDVSFIGWSFYPFAVMFLLGALLLYLAINKTARETMERKLFF